ncbi:hypothetical protein LC608_05010 [Nostoc sp. XA010]|uniref:hypothetical protein n=1 Tax=Nostoc sp. XA010 TaxID=2780407 RepID=UPI001E6400F3|nr:hypothetical protein [Nostoc sp. XA010]MCC5656354.1 hypothetical protein [Nostoc sp. XA010]
MIQTTKFKTKIIKSMLALFVLLGCSNSSQVETSAKTCPPPQKVQVQKYTNLKGEFIYIGASTDEDSPVTILPTTVAEFKNDEASMKVIANLEYEDAIEV